MFTATIGAYNQRTQPVFQPQPREWKRVIETEPTAELKRHDPAKAGQRKAGKTTLTGQPRDPTWELEKEILGK